MNNDNSLDELAALAQLGREVLRAAHGRIQHDLGGVRPASPPWLPAGAARHVMTRARALGLEELSDCDPEATGDGR